MPVSNPSYFPDIRGDGSIIGITAGRNATGSNDFLAGNNTGANSTVNDLIIIGNGSGAAGITGADLAGSIIIGVNSAPLITVGTGGGSPLVLIGSNNLTRFGALEVDGIDTTVLVGSNILNGNSEGNLSGLVFIGTDLFPTSSLVPASSNTVCIGYQIATAPALNTQSIFGACVLIGSRQFTSSFANQFNGCVFIGDAFELINNESVCPGNIGIGSSMVIPSGANSESNVMIGVAMTFAGSTGSANTVIGGGNDWGGSGNVILGAGAKAPNLPGDTTYGCVIIGNGAGNSISGSVTLNHVFLIEAQQGASGGGATPLALLYGSFATGNLILGQSVDGTNRDLEGTNTVKLLNGTIGGADPVGGGYFYVTAGALHWVGSSGTDTAIAPA
jgi:hypothetical protein